MKQSQINTGVPVWPAYANEATSEKMNYFNVFLTPATRSACWLASWKEAGADFSFTFFTLTLYFVVFDGENTSTSVHNGLEHQQNIKVSL